MTAAAAASSSRASHFKGRLEWRVLLRWLRDDGVLPAAEADKLAQRFAAGDSAQHPLVRLGAAGLADARTGTTLDVEVLTEWLAKRCGLPYLRIDPLKVDVARVADVMSINYAERRRSLPVGVT